MSSASFGGKHFALKHPNSVAPWQGRAQLNALAFGSARQDAAHPNRGLPDCSILEAGIVALALPTDFTRIGSTACASRQQLKLLICPKLRITAKEAFLKRTSLQEVSTPALHGAMRCCRQYALSSNVQTKKKQNMAKDICP